MLTPDGQAWLLELVRDSGSAVTIRILGPDNAVAEVPCEENFPIVEEGEVVFSGFFDGDAANFHWTAREVVVGSRVVDREEVDLGTKVAGSEWRVKPRVSFAALTPSGD